MDIQKARDDCDEVQLSVAIDLAKELGDEYPYLQELYEAEDHLYDLMQCTDDLPSFKLPEADDSPVFSDHA